MENLVEQQESQWEIYNNIYGCYKFSCSCNKVLWWNKTRAGGLVEIMQTANLLYRKLEQQNIQRKIYIIDFPYEKYEIESIIDSFNGEYLDKGFNERVGI